MVLIHYLICLYLGSKENRCPWQRVGQELSRLDQQELPFRHLQRDEEKLSEKDAVSVPTIFFLRKIFPFSVSKFLIYFRRYCRVLVYDWSEPGDAEIVVEDIENLNMDNIDAYEDQQSDWRFFNEELASIIRCE